MISSPARSIEYPHKTNYDGTINSVCPHCSAHIGTSIWEADLERMEAAHLCESAPFTQFGFSFSRTFDFAVPRV